MAHGGRQDTNLDLNFCSTRALVGATSTLIAHNAPDRAQKQLRARRALDAPALRRVIWTVSCSGSSTSCSLVMMLMDTLS